MLARPGDTNSTWTDFYWSPEPVDHSCSDTTQQYQMSKSLSKLNHIPLDFTE